MNRIFPFIQFFPLAVFLYVGRKQGWELAFEYGALAAIAESAAIYFLMGNRINRMIAGANLFLVLGGAGFYFKIQSILNFLNTKREAAVILSVGIVCGLSTLLTPAGVFEYHVSVRKLERKYSLIFLVGIAAAYFWSVKHRGNTTMAGTIPFVFLILLKQLLQRELIKR
jgi:hypothetical protein